MEQNRGRFGEDDPYYLYTYTIYDSRDKRLNWPLFPTKEKAQEYIDTKFRYEEGIMYLKVEYVEVKCVGWHEETCSYELEFTTPIKEP